MSASNLDNNANRDGSDASQNFPPAYFDNARFNVVDPALSLYDGHGVSGNPQFSHYHPNNLIGQGFALPAGQDQYMQDFQQTAFDNEWDRHLVDAGQNEYGSNIFNNPYDQQHTRASHNGSGYSPPLPSDAANRDADHIGVQNYTPGYNKNYQSSSNTEQENLVVPWTLQTAQQGFMQDYQVAAGNQHFYHSPRPNTTSSSMHSAMPPGEVSGNFVITRVEDLNNHVRCQPLNNFVHIGLEPQETSITKTALPTYAARKSRNEIMSLLKNDSSLKSKINKKLRKTTDGSPKRAKSRNTSILSTKVTATSKRSTSDDDSDEEDSSSDDSEGESLKPPIPAVRPDDPIEGVSYDVVKALWRVPYRSATRDDIQRGLSDFWKVVGTIRSRWKTDTAALQEAEAAKKLDDVARLKQRVANQRHMLETALRTALKHGHKDLLEHLGRHSPLMAAMAATLQDRARDADYKSDLTTLILQILSKCATMIEDETLSKTTMVKIVQRFSKRGEENVKALAETILHQASSSIKKEGPGKSVANTESQSKGITKDASKAEKSNQIKHAKREELAIGKKEKLRDDDKSTSASHITASASTGIKRQRESDSRPSPSSKKVAIGSASDQSVSATKPSSTTTDSKQSANAPGVKKVVPKPPNYFSSLQPTYKKSSATPAAGSAADTKETAARVEKSVTIGAAETAKPVVQSAPTFSFSATMANLKRPKEVEPEPKKVETVPQETPEEKAARLRREKRRNMRVTFKPEPELTEIRYFEHDPDEELGHNANQVRDVGDLESEGRMFKMKQQAKQLSQNDPDTMDLDDDEDEDDEHDNDEEDLLQKEYPLPTDIDFSDIPDETREINYAPLGGGKASPDSPEAAEQKLREEETLVVLYARESDIPSSPKEPPESMEESETPKEFGTISKGEHDWFASRLHSLQAKTQPPQPSASADLYTILGSLGQIPPTNTQPAQQTPSATDIEEIIKHLTRSTGNPQQPSKQESQQQPQYQQQFQPFPAPQQSQLPSSIPLIPQQPQSNPYSNQQANNAQIPTSSDISALLASVNRQYQTQAQPSYAAPMGGTETSAVQHQSHPYGSEDRGRYGGSYGGSEPQNQQRPWQNKKQFEPNRPNAKYKVEPCKFFPKGQCTKGADCTYRHDMV